MLENGCSILKSRGAFPRSPSFCRHTTSSLSRWMLQYDILYSTHSCNCADNLLSELGIGRRLLLQLFQQFCDSNQVWVVFLKLLEKVLLDPPVLFTNAKMEI